MLYNCTVQLYIIHGLQKAKMHRSDLFFSTNLQMVKQLYLIPISVPIYSLKNKICKVLN